VTIPQQSSNCKFFRLVQGPVVYCALQLRDEYLLSLIDNTISTYRGRILEKIRMKTNAELTHYAVQNKLVN